jgi:hypothetical protein
MKQALCVEQKKSQFQQGIACTTTPVIMQNEMTRFLLFFLKNKNNK